MASCWQASDPVRADTGPVLWLSHERFFSQVSTQPGALNQRGGAQPIIHECMSMLQTLQPNVYVAGTVPATASSIEEAPGLGNCVNVHRLQTPGSCLQQGEPGEEAPEMRAYASHWPFVLSTMLYHVTGFGSHVASRILFGKGAECAMPCLELLQ